MRSTSGDPTTHERGMSNLSLSEATLARQATTVMMGMASNARAEASAAALAVSTNTTSSSTMDVI